MKEDPEKAYIEKYHFRKKADQNRIHNTALKLFQ